MLIGSPLTRATLFTRPFFSQYYNSMCVLVCGYGCINMSKYMCVYISVRVHLAALGFVH